MIDMVEITSLLNGVKQNPQLNFSTVNDILTIRFIWLINGETYIYQERFSLIFINSERLSYAGDVERLMQYANNAIKKYVAEDKCNL